jgi:ribosomal protein L24E
LQTAATATTTTVQQISCNFCNNNIQKGIFCVIDNILLYFDSGACKQRYIEHERVKKNQLARKLARMRKCEYCGNEFDPKYSSSKKRYCSLQCFGKVAYIQGSKYRNNFYCDCCESWIPKKDAVWKQFRLIKRVVCPKSGCNNNKLKTKGRSRNRNHNNNKGANNSA